MTTRRKRQGTVRAKAVSGETERRSVWLGGPGQAERRAEMNTEEAGPDPSGACGPQ